MKQIPFIGGMLRGRARQADPQETLNLYVRKDAVTGRDFLFGMPGLTPFFGASQPDIWEGNSPGTCTTPNLTLTLSSTMWCIECSVLSVSSDGLTITIEADSSIVYPITRAASGDGGRVAFNGTLKDIESCTSHSNKWTITVSSAFSGLEDGDRLCVETNDSIEDFPHKSFDWMGTQPDYSMVCLGSAIFYATGNCWPFTLKTNCITGSYTTAREAVEPNFVWYDCYDPTSSCNIRITDTDGNNSNAVELACTATAEFDTDNNPETMSNNDFASFTILEGAPPFTITITGTDFWLNSVKTETTLVTSSSTFTVYTGPSACGGGLLTLVDSCGATAYQGIRSTFSGIWRRYQYGAIPSDPDCHALYGWYCGPANGFSANRDYRIQGYWYVNSNESGGEGAQGLCGDPLYCNTTDFSCCNDISKGCETFCAMQMLLEGGSGCVSKFVAQRHIPFTRICLTRLYSGVVYPYIAASGCVKNVETHLPYFCLDSSEIDYLEHPYCGIPGGDPSEPMPYCNVKCYCLLGDTFYRVFRWECP